MYVISLKEETRTDFFYISKRLEETNDITKNMTVNVIYKIKYFFIYF